MTFRMLHSFFLINSYISSLGHRCSTGIIWMSTLSSSKWNMVDSIFLSCLEVRTVTGPFIAISKKTEDERRHTQLSQIASYTHKSLTGNHTRFLDAFNTVYLDRASPNIGLLEPNTCRQTFTTLRTLTLILITNLHALGVHTWTLEAFNMWFLKAIPRQRISCSHTNTLCMKP